MLCGTGTQRMLRRTLDRLRHGRSSVQYEVQRRTFRGGWTNYYAEFDPDGSSSFETPPDPLDLSEPANHPPGAYRCIKRVGGHIASVVWTRETADAEAYYEERRRAVEQQDRLEEMSLDEIRQAFEEGKTFDALAPHDVREEVLKKQLTHQGPEDQSSGQADTRLRDRLVRDVAEEEGPREALRVLKDVKRAENGLCAYCSTNAHDRCDKCGELVCREHNDPGQGGCTFC